jgi:hypothetical protein
MLFGQTKQLDQALDSSARVESCAGASGGHNDLGRPSLACSTPDKVSTCLCSSDWDPKCECMDTNYGSTGTAIPVCTGTAGSDDGNGRPSFICSNGVDVIGCLCSADWKGIDPPVCHCNINPNIFSSATRVDCASSSGGSYGRPSLICASDSEYVICMCSADWEPCRCTKGTFSQQGNIASCASAWGYDDNYCGGADCARPSLMCTNGVNSVACMCSDDWGGCSCTEI